MVHNMWIFEWQINTLYHFFKIGTELESSSINQKPEMSETKNKSPSLIMLKQQK